MVFTYDGELLTYVFPEVPQIQELCLLLTHLEFTVLVQCLLGNKLVRREADQQHGRFICEKMKCFRILNGPEVQKTNHVQTGPVGISASIQSECFWPGRLDC